jgi:hypothetical protein
LKRGLALALRARDQSLRCRTRHVQIYSTTMGVTVVQPDAMCIFGLTPKPPQGLDIAAARIVGPSLPILVDLHRGSTECRASEEVW